MINHTRYLKIPTSKYKWNAAKDLSLKNLTVKLHPLENGHVGDNWNPIGLKGHCLWASLVLGH